MTDPPLCYPLGYAEIGALLAVKPVTVRQWKWKRQMPAPDYPSIHGMPAWERSTIVTWAGDLGKLHDPALIEEFRKINDREPHKYRKGGRMAAADRLERETTP